MTERVIIKYEISTWMKKIKPQNTTDEFYELGQMMNMKNTLLITKVGGNGGGMLYCKTHGFAYQIKGACEECRNTVRDVAIDASVTSCDTPENQPETERR